MKLSIITATYNAVENLPKLIESLRNQEDKDFEWVVADGASTDGTLELLQSITDLNIKISSQEDFGIYDALNRAIKISNGEFYLVVGADDYFYTNAIRDYKSEIYDSVDILTATINCGEKKISAKNRGKSWIFGMNDYVSSHAVGCVYRKKLHENFGWYSRKFPIVADQLFTLKAIHGGANVKVINKEVGFYNDSGVSSIDVVGTISELYRVQLTLGRNKLMQTLLLFLRIFKNFKKIK
ncbi:glycosyltransferase [Comamonas jiangduensis]|uniref:glycosyltransferase n=1 Tax=Comamonas jiangduensis TaxID=1194168 RepID=UPI003BF8E349